jgi:hypothetical protein
VGLRLPPGAPRPATRQESIGTSFLLLRDFVNAEAVLPWHDEQPMPSARASFALFLQDSGRNG